MGTPEHHKGLFVYELSCQGKEFVIGIAFASRRAGGGLYNGLHYGTWIGYGIMDLLCIHSCMRIAYHQYIILCLYLSSLWGVA